MPMCRTCLSKNDLRLIFPDKNLVSYHSYQLHLICGIKIEPGDGLSQLICEPCSKLFDGALKLRESSLKSEQILKKNLEKSKKIESVYNESQSTQTSEITPVQNEFNRQEDKNEIQNLNEQRKNDKNFKKVSKTKRLDIDKEFLLNYEPESTVRIEDYESSNDSDFINNYLVEELDTIPIDNYTTICIDDFESSGSMDQDFNNIMQNESKDAHKNHWDLKEKELLERERRKQILKEKDAKLLSLAAKPYDAEGPVKCTLCGKQLRNLHSFKCHAKTHFEPPNACEDCGKRFVNPSHMRYHQQRVHGRKKRLGCSTCPYRAVDLLQLQNHERAEHTGERPFICDVCGDSFRMRANIRQHMRKHFGVRNLQDLEPTVDVSAQRLSDQVRVIQRNHRLDDAALDRLRSECERCPAMFRSQAELTAHQNRVHYLQYDYLCYLCPETYKRPATVRKHLEDVHGVPKDQQISIKCVKTRRSSCDKSD